MRTLIVGGGPAGTAAAITLASGGARPVLLERTTEPHDVVCGGFLGWDALALLGALGIDALALGARPISRLRLVTGTRTVEARLPHPAAGLSRRTLDVALLAAAEHAGAEVRRGVTVRGAEPDGRSVRLHDGAQMTCDALLLATGKHELRGLARPLADHRDGLAIGLRAALPHSPAREVALAGTIELHLFDGGYAGLLLQEDGATNVCLSVSSERLAAAGAPLPLMEAIVRQSSLLGERIGDDWPAAPNAIAGVPYGWRARTTLPGLFRLGDQGAVISSLAGDGVAIALASGTGAAQALLARGPGSAAAWQASFARQSARPLALANALRHGAEHRVVRSALMAAVRLAPGLAGSAARLTRIV